MQTVTDKQKNSFKALKETLKISNPMEVPSLVKIVISAGTGSFSDKKKNAIVEDRLAKITGQKASPRGAKKSVASFKVRAGDVVGYQVTLRGPRMNHFFDKLINVAFPRTKDFKGISRDAIDEMGNLTIGIKEHSIFPETVDEELKDVFGMAVTIVSSTKDKESAEKFFEYLGVPFKKV